MKKFKINGKTIGENQRCYIIAEIGNNHEGSKERAKELIKAAADSGADAVKFQTFKAENIIIPKGPKAKYHIETTGTDKKLSWFDLLKSQEISEKPLGGIFPRI